MSRTCESCSSPNRRELDRKIRSGSTLPDLQRWLASLDEPRSINALTRHRQHTLPDKLPPGPRPRGASFLADVEETAWQDMSLGVLRPSIRDAIGARAEMNRQSEKQQDRQMLQKLAQIMTGHVPAGIAQARVLDPWETAWETERGEIEAEFRALLPAGDGTEEAREFDRSATARRAALQGD